MTESRKQVGRVVFNPNQAWVVLTLKCHVDNVTKLVEIWDSERAYLTNLPPTLPLPVGPLSNRPIPSPLVLTT